MGMQVLNIVKVFGLKFGIACSILLITSCNQPNATVPYYFSPDLSPTWELESNSSEDHHIDNFDYTSHLGGAFGTKDLVGKYYIANFFFTSCPSICPKMTANLKEVAEAFEQNESVRLVSFSVTPEIDSVSRLEEYHDRFNLPENWFLLTGNQSDIYHLSRHSFFVEEEIGLSKDSSDFLHTERCMLVDREGRIRGVYNATVALDMERIITDLTLLLKEGKE